VDASPNHSPVSWINGFRQYLQEVRVEFDKISWPSQKEYVGGTVGVLIIVALMTVFLGILDWLLSLGFNWLIESLPRWLNG
jgi:preprotein translocase subunit SecE